jgi:hypothetical protein
MDVQPVDAAASASPPLPPPVAITYDQGPAPVVTPLQPVAVASAAPPDAAQSTSKNGATGFTQAASQIFGGSSSSNDDVTVSIRVAQEPNQIITVFRDAHGNVIQQVPSEVVVRLAEFFDQQLGALLDRNA